MDSPRPKPAFNPFHAALCASAAIHAVLLFSTGLASPKPPVPAQRVVVRLAPPPAAVPAPKAASKPLSAKFAQASPESFAAAPSPKPREAKPTPSPAPKLVRKSDPARKSAEAPVAAAPKAAPSEGRYEKTREALARAEAVRTECAAKAEAAGQNPGLGCDELAGLARDESLVGRTAGSVLAEIASGADPGKALRGAWKAEGVRIVYIVDGKVASAWRQSDDPRDPHDNAAEIIAAKFDLAAIWAQAGPEPKGAIQTIDLPALSIKERFGGLDRTRSYSHIRARYSYVAVRSGSAVAVAFMPADQSPAGSVSRPLTEEDFDILSKLPDPRTGAARSPRS